MLRAESQTTNLTLRDVAAKLLTPPISRRLAERSDRLKDGGPGHRRPLPAEPAVVVSRTPQTSAGWLSPEAGCHGFGRSEVDGHGDCWVRSMAGPADGRVE